MVSASSRLGVDGTVVVNSPIVDLSGNLRILPSSYLKADALYPKQCATREEETSSFVVDGRDGLPPQPDSLLLSK